MQENRKEALVLVDNVHLDVLSRLSVLLMDEDFTNKLRQAASVSEFKQIIEDAEKSS